MMDWISPILDRLDLASRTKDQYASVLRYWAIWYQVRYGTQFPLACVPPSPVPTAALEDFFEDHRAVPAMGGIRLNMAATTLQCLRDAGLNMSVQCVSPRTTEWRVSVLSKAHRGLDLRIDQDFILTMRRRSYSMWESAHASLGALSSLPIRFRAAVWSLCNACSNDDEGAMDKAMVLLLCRLSTKQVANIQFDDVMPGILLRDGFEQDVVSYTPNDSASELQRSQGKFHIVGAHARLVKIWGAIREAEGGSHGYFFRRRLKDGSLSSLSEIWVRRRFSYLRDRAGLRSIGGRRPVTPQWLRKSYENEFYEELTAVRVARKARIGTRAAVRMINQLRSANSV